MSFNFLSIRSVDEINDKHLNTLYLELKKELGITQGTEDWERTQELVVNGLTYITKKLKTLTTRVFFSLRNTIEKIVSRYDTIIEKWDDRLKSNLHRVDENKFTAHIRKLIPYRILQERIHALYKVHHILDHLELICDAPIKEDSDDWRTPEILAAFKAMDQIGFNVHRFNLISKVTSTYDDVATKDTLGALGYSISSLPEIINNLKPLAKYANTSYIDTLTKRFLTYADKLHSYEESLTSLAQDANYDNEDYDKQKRVLDIKLARLWWITHFIKSSFVVAEDILITTLTLCKIAEMYTIPDED